MEVMSPATKNVQNYIANLLSVYVHRGFRAKEKMGFLPFIQSHELSSEMSSLPEPVLRKRLKNCAYPMVKAFSLVKITSLRIYFF